MYCWPEDDPLRSKRVARLNIQQLVVVLTAVYLLYQTQRDEKRKKHNFSLRPMNVTFRDNVRRFSTRPVFRETVPFLKNVPVSREIFWDAKLSRSLIWEFLVPFTAVMQFVRILHRWLASSVCVTFAF